MQFVKKIRVGRNNCKKFRTGTTNCKNAVEKENSQKKLFGRTICTINKNLVQNGSLQKKLSKIHQELLVLVLPILFWPYWQSPAWGFCMKISLIPIKGKISLIFLLPIKSALFNFSLMLYWNLHHKIDLKNSIVLKNELMSSELKKINGHLAAVIPLVVEMTSLNCASIFSSN